MKIIHVCSEYAPLIKSGGLGDAVAGLAKEQARIGHEVHILIPKYNAIKINDLNEEIRFPSPLWEYSHSNTMWTARYGDVHLHLLEMPHLFKSDHLYGLPDDVPRFLYFSRAVLEYLKKQAQPIDVLHLHDWHTAPLASLCRDHSLKIPTLVFSIHNLEYQGQCGIYDLQSIGLKDLAPFQGTNPAHPESYNCLRGGIECSDVIITVSPTYAKEILTPQFGFGLDQVLTKHATKLYGIINGIDEEIWNPSTNEYLVANYKNTDSIEEILAAKQKIRESIAKKYNLKMALPWFGSVTRLALQKGPELLITGLEETIQLGGIFALLGSTSPDLQSKFELLKKKYADNPQVLLEITFDDALAHQLYAALDFILIPSHFEPCGLTQLIAMRYGTIPIARSTGGLKDTVTPENGFLFHNPTQQELVKSMHRAFDQWQNNQPAYRAKLLHGMQTDFSWKKPVQEYLKIYSQ